MTYCPDCGKEISPNDAHCDYCGATVSQAIPTSTPPMIIAEKKTPPFIKWAAIGIGILVLIIVGIVILGYNGPRNTHVPPIETPTPTPTPTTVSYWPPTKTLHMVSRGCKFFQGGDLPDMPLYKESPYECTDLCASRSDCFYVTWVAANTSRNSGSVGACWLKGSYGAGIRDFPEDDCNYVKPWDWPPPADIPESWVKE